MEATHEDVVVRPSTRRRSATKRERLTRSERAQRREQEKQKEHVGLRERLEGVRDGVTSHPRLFIALLTVVLSAVMVFGPARDYYVAMRSGQDLQAYYDALMEQNEELRGELERLQTREGVVDEAHKRGYVSEDEVMVDVEGLTGVISAPLPEVEVKDERPWYVRVLDYIFGYEFGMWQ